MDEWLRKEGRLVRETVSVERGGKLGSGWKARKL